MKKNKTKQKRTNIAEKEDDDPLYIQTSAAIQIKSERFQNKRERERESGIAYSPSSYTYFTACLSCDRIEPDQSISNASFSLFSKSGRGSFSLPLLSS